VQSDDGWLLVYDLDVADAGSSSASGWSQDAQQHGEVGETGGPAGREYGWH
jgi:hypothetical protein